MRRTVTVHYYLVSHIIVINMALLGTFSGGTDICNRLETLTVNIFAFYNAPDGRK
jgi:hypothetical protein